MGCGSSVPAGAKYAASDAPPETKDPAVDVSGGDINPKSAYIAACKARAAKKQDYDVTLSFEGSFARELYEDVTSELAKDYKVAPRGVKSLHKSSRLIVFLSPPYFDSKECCAEFCEAIKAGVEVVLVCVEGSMWKDASGNDMPFPAISDVPAGAPRDAASILFGLTIAIDHKARYLPTFVEKLRQRIGPPAAMMKSVKKAPPRVAGEGREIRFDAFLSHKRSESQDTVARVHDKLLDLGYRAFIDRNDLVELPSLKLAVRDTSTLIAFLTPQYFKSAWCMLEICEAVEHDVPVLFVTVDGASWGGKPFPSEKDVPESIVVHDDADVTIKPRAAFKKIVEASSRLSHSRSYFGSLIESLGEALGPPPTTSALEGEAREMWQAAGGGASLAWPAVRKQLQAKGGAGYASCEGIISKALGVRSVDDATLTVSAVAFASLFASGASFKATVEALGGGATAKASSEERLLTATLEEAGGETNCGSALVGPATTLEEIRTQLTAVFEEERSDDPLLSSGRFHFLVKGKAVRRKQEKLLRGKHIDAIRIAKSEAKAQDAAAADEPAAESAAEAAKAQAQAAAKQLIAASARREADMLDLDDVLRDPLRAASLRRHATAAASAVTNEAGAFATSKAARTAAEKQCQLAIQTFQLNDALAKNNSAAALKVAEQLRAYIKGDAALLKKIGTNASPAEIATGLQAAEMGARAAMRPALERMREEMIKAAGGAAMSGSKGAGEGVKRVVVLGGGPCGASIAHQLLHIHEGFHVTVIDTKEFYEDTPTILRMMTGHEHDVDRTGKCHYLWEHITISFADIMRGKGEFICGSAAAVRKDHVLVGTTTGIASRVVPYDYLVVCTGTSYQSDIKSAPPDIKLRTAARTPPPCLLRLAAPRLCVVLRSRGHLDRAPQGVFRGGARAHERGRHLRRHRRRSRRRRASDRPQELLSGEGGGVLHAWLWLDASHPGRARVDQGGDRPAGHQARDQQGDCREQRQGQSDHQERRGARLRLGLVAHLLVHRLHAEQRLPARCAYGLGHPCRARSVGLRQGRQGLPHEQRQGPRAHLRRRRHCHLGAPRARRAHRGLGVVSRGRDPRKHSPRFGQARGRAEDGGARHVCWRRPPRRLARHERGVAVRDVAVRGRLLPGPGGVPCQVWQDRGGGRPGVAGALSRSGQGHGRGHGLGEPRHVHDDPRGRVQDVHAERHGHLANVCHPCDDGPLRPRRRGVVSSAFELLPAVGDGSAWGG